MLLHAKAATQPPELALACQDRSHTAWAPYETLREAHFRDPCELVATLKHMRERNERFLDTYLFAEDLLASSSRHEEGVVFVPMLDVHGQEVVVMFFMSTRLFDIVAGHYANSALQAVMPRALAINSNARAELCCSNGHPFLPHIVTPAAETLKEWAVRSHPSFSGMLTALLEVARHLAHMHASGIVHCNLCPDTIVWQPTMNAWALAGMQWSTDVGLPSNLEYHPHYSAPELYRATKAGKRTVKACTAVDMWSLGVVAFELLTKTPVFPRALSAIDIADQVLGKASLPWEDAVQKAALLPRLKLLKRSVLMLLSREPQKRPTASDVLGAWQGLSRMIEQPA